MGNCIKKRELRDIEIELEMLKTDNRLQLESITSELSNIRQLIAPKDRRRSYNPYIRKQTDIKYI